ncbi:YkvA family protein [Rufibacter radiotolerans]|uniref:YkvA family protein n=1 Tax=Rufibacter radiotolerans TaxID=1379910 RepID=UPI00069D8E70|nr:YkvA family protein [Rufibacter radiotolerans]
MENQSDKNVHESSVFKKFLNKAEEYVKQPLRVKELLNDAYQKASEKKDFGTIATEAFESLATLSRMIRAAVTKEYHGIPTSTVVMGVAVIIYFLSPIDLIPDWIPIIGLLDDVSLLAWFMTSIKTEMDKFQAWEAAQPHKTTAADSGADLATSMDVDTSAHTPKYGNEPAGQYGTTHATSPSSSGYGSSGQQVNPTYGEGNMRMGNSSSRSQGQGSTGGEIPTQNDIPVTSYTTVEGTPEQEIHPTNTPDARPTDHGVPTGYGEPNVRASTTDSTRVPSRNSDDMDHGGNIR